MTQGQPTTVVKLFAYLAVFACALVLVIGLLAAAFEEDTGIRVAGGLAAVLGMIVGNLIASRAWPKKRTAEDK